MVECADDVRAALAGTPRSLVLALPDEGSDEAFVLEALDPSSPRGADSLADLVGIACARVIAALISLELSGLALALPGGRYLRATAPPSHQGMTT